MDGKIIIGTEVDTSGVREGLIDVEEISRQVSEKIGKDLTDSQRKKLEKEVGNINEVLETFYSKLYEYGEMVSELGNDPVLFQSEVKEAAKLKKEILDMIPLINKITGDKIIIPGFNDIEKKIPKINSGLKSIIKTVAKWGLAIFSIRSMYMLIRQAVSTIAQEDEGIATKIEYMRYIIATTLKPVVEWIVNAAYKILTLFGGIVKAIFGVNIFANATADGFAKAKSSASSLKKTLAGFDEMNIINEGGTSGLLGDIKGALADLGDLNVQVEEFADKIKRWFLGPGNETVGEALKNSFKNFPKWLKEIFSPVYNTIIRPYFIDPIKQSVEALKPVWEPVVDAFEEGIDEMKLAWQPFLDYINPNVIEPLKEKWKEFKDYISKTWNDAFKGILPIIGPYINDIIYAINSAFGIFGVKLDYLKWDVEQTSNEAKKDIQQNISNPLTEVWNKLKELTKKTWKIDTIFSSSGSIGGTVKSWLQPLRDALAQIGIKLPKLAQGGIVNNPGPGIMMGSYVAGERGAEAVLPLTDDTLQRLANMIPITVNLSNNMNGRVISREIIKTQNESDFAFNR